MKSIEAYLDVVNQAIEERINRPEFQEPKGLYAPCKYILQNGGKRVRASSVLMACKMFSNTYQQAIPVAMAFETFHNFTLIHDDIMDKASIRRGKPTVHVKWDENTAILSGDAVMIMAYRFFEESKDCKCMSELFHLLNTTALEVCEGQQYDIDLERANVLSEEVTMPAYIRMIELKTSVLLAACLKAGAIIGGASAADADKMYEVGRQIGIAFQLQDDVLDSYGNEATFGKHIGGDIHENKKTCLLITALNTLQGSDREELVTLLSKNNIAEETKLEEVLALYNKAQVKEKTLELIKVYFSNASDIVASINVPEAQKAELTLFMKELIHRAY